jgi:hypothetical protein
VVSESLYKRTVAEAPIDAAPEEETCYRAIVSAGIQDISFDSSSQVWRLTQTADRKFLHPMIPNFAFISHLLIAYLDGADAEDTEFIGRMTLPRTVGGLEINLVGGIVVVPGQHTGIKPFTVYATSSYGSRNGAIQRYDCVQTSYGAPKDQEECLNIYDEVIHYPFSQVGHGSLCLFMFDYVWVSYVCYVCLRFL